MRLLTHYLCALSIGLTCLSAYGRLNVVTLPDRDTVQLTIYNAVDLTLVKETRHLTFHKGVNKLEFSWANTLIDPTSVEFAARTHTDEISVVDVRFPPRVANTLEWRINSDYAGEALVEIRYFTSGISWSADYVAEAVTDESAMQLSGAVRVTNNSGEDYENAQVRLVVGVIRLVEDIAALARRGEERERAMTSVLKSKSEVATRFYSLAGARMAGAGGRLESLEAAKQIVKEGMSEYFLYTVGGRDTIQNGWSKRLPSFSANAVPISSYYKFEQEMWGDSVMRYYRFTNSAPSHLGTEPLPDGAVKAFRSATKDNLYSYVGSTSVKYIPINETVDLELGNDSEVSVKPTLMDWQKSDIRFDGDGNVAGWTIKQSWKVEVQNSKEIPVTLDIRRNLTGDWDLTASAPQERMDAGKVKFVLPLKAREKKTFTYEVVTREGLNQRR